MNNKIFRRTFLGVLAAAVLPAEQNFAVITQADNPRSITRIQLKRALLGQEAHWPGGGKITVVLGPSGDPGRIAVLKEYAGITESELYKIIMHLNFTGQGEFAPITAASFTSVMQAVRSKPGAVGVVPLSSLNPTVKKIEIE